MTTRLNFDRDLLEQMEREFQPSSPAFRGLPLVEQLRLLKPYMQVQEARDQKRLGRMTERQVANG